MAVRLPVHRRSRSPHPSLALSTRSEPVLNAERSRHGCNKSRLWSSTYAKLSFSSPSVLPAALNTTLKLTRSDRYHISFIPLIRCPFSCASQYCVPCATCTPTLGFMQHAHAHTDWRCCLSQSTHCDRHLRTRALHPAQLHQLFDVSITCVPTSQLVLSSKRVFIPGRWGGLILTDR